MREDLPIGSEERNFVDKRLSGRLSPIGLFFFGFAPLTLVANFAVLNFAPGDCSFRLTFFLLRFLEGYRFSLVGDLPFERRIP